MNAEHAEHALEKAASQLAGQEFDSVPGREHLVTWLLQELSWLRDATWMPAYKRPVSLRFAQAIVEHTERKAS